MYACKFSVCPKNGRRSSTGVIAASTLSPERSSHYDRGFGGGLGLGTPVVSYAPLPMFIMSSPLSIIEEKWQGSEGAPKSISI